MESISYLELLEIHFIISAPTMIVGALITYFTVLNKRVKTGSAFWMLIIRFAISFFLSLWIWSLSLPIPFDIACFTTPAIIAELFCWILTVVLYYLFNHHQILSLNRPDNCEI